MLKYIPWLFAIVAMWLIAAPFVLGYSNMDVAMQNDIGVGAVTLMGALAWWFSEWRGHGFHTHADTLGR
jgi:hypothetical protein